MGIYSAVDIFFVSILALFDACSAFDIVDHDILRRHLETFFGLNGSSLFWFRSYVTDRSKIVILADSCFLYRYLSNMGLFNVQSWSPSLLCLQLISPFFAKHSAVGDLFADYVQFFVQGPSVHQLVLAQSIESLSLFRSSLSAVLESKYLKDSADMARHPQQLLKLDFAILSERFPLFTFLTSDHD